MVTTSSLVTKDCKQVSTRIADIIGTKAHLPLLFENYNEEHNKNYHIKEMAFPKDAPYGWNNYPYDYYNIWVKNAGDKTFYGRTNSGDAYKRIPGYYFQTLFPCQQYSAR